MLSLHTIARAVFYLQVFVLLWQQSAFRYAANLPLSGTDDYIVNNQNIS